MISGMPGEALTTTRFLGQFLFWQTVVAFLLTTVLIAQDSVPAGSQAAVSSATICNSLAAGLPHSDALRIVCQYAVTLPQRMPNFRCEQTASRFVDGVPTDVIAAIVTFQDGGESYQEVKANGRPASKATLLGLGEWSTGQFGSNLRALFDTNNKVSFRFANEAKLSGHRAVVFQYGVAKQDLPTWQLQVGDQIVAPPYRGRLWIDESSGKLLQFEMSTSGLPQEFPMSNAEFEIDYGEVPFGDGTSFLLPVRSVVSSDYRDGKQNRNVLQFRNCHKFRATAQVVP